MILKPKIRWAFVAAADDKKDIALLKWASGQHGRSHHREAILEDNSIKKVLTAK